MPASCQLATGLVGKASRLALSLAAQLAGIRVQGSHGLTVGERSIEKKVVFCIELCVLMAGEDWCDGEGWTGGSTADEKPEAMQACAACGQPLPSSSPHAKKKKRHKWAQTGSNFSATGSEDAHLCTVDADISTNGLTRLNFSSDLQLD